MKNSNDTNWDRTSDLPICSTAPYPLCYRGPQPKHLWVFLSMKYVRLNTNSYLSKFSVKSDTLVLVVNNIFLIKFSHNQHFINILNAMYRNTQLQLYIYKYICIQFLHPVYWTSCCPHADQILSECTTWKGERAWLRVGFHSVLQRLLLPLRIFR